MTDGRSSVTVYDPDGVNPYAREVAYSLAQAGGCRVRLITTNRSNWAPGNVEMRFWLSRGRREGVFKWAAKRVAGPLLTIADARRSSSVLVVAWSRDVWDALVLAVYARLRPWQVFVVDHNPIPERAKGGWAGRAERMLLRSAATSIVHSAELTTAAAARSRRVEVYPHPPYAAWVERFLDCQRHDEPGRRVLFIGATRADKRIGDAIAALEMCHLDGLTLVIAGAVRDQLDISAGSSLSIESPAGGDVVDDEDLARALMSCDLVIAPYSAVTTSGSLLMARQAGLPVVGYLGLRHVTDPYVKSVPFGEVQALSAAVTEMLSGAHPAHPANKSALQILATRTGETWWTAMSRARAEQ